MTLAAILPAGTAQAGQPPEPPTQPHRQDREDAHPDRDGVAEDLEPVLGLVDQIALRRLDATLAARAADGDEGRVVRSSVIVGGLEDGEGGAGQPRQRAMFSAVGRQRLPPAQRQSRKKPPTRQSRRPR